MSIQYSDDIRTLESSQLEQFFVDWPDPPDQDTHLKILRGSLHVWLALEDGRCVGFINAISDGVFYAFVPLLEVLPTHQGRGIGSELTRRMLTSLNGMYAIDVVCDPNVVPFYERFGFRQSTAMIRRNYSRQSAGS